MEKNNSKNVVNLCMEDTFAIDDLEERRLYINDEIDELPPHICDFSRELGGTI